MKQLAAEKVAEDNFWLANFPGKKHCLWKRNKKKSSIPLRTNKTIGSGSMITIYITKN